METPNILVVDDNSEIRNIVNILLSGEGYHIREAAEGSEALDLLQEQDFDLIILDVMMPGMDGYQTCLNIRKQSNAPILFLSARTQDSDKTLGFSSGGDDYLAKPFSYHELLGRVKALLRRYNVYKGKADPDEPAINSGTVAFPSIKAHTLQKGPLKILSQEQCVLLNEEKIELTDTEYAILLLLAEHETQIFSASHLYEAIWQEPYYYGANNTIMVHIRNLRKKIEADPQNPKLIRTIWGKGYRFG